MEMAKENILGTKPIPALLRQFALPSIVSMTVNSIYNIVDQVFIGQKIGYLGNAATNVTFPFVTVFLAVALMISIGTAANVGLNLGRKDQERADQTLGNGIMIAVVAAVLLVTVAQIFMPSLLRFFGATELVMPYALDYARIYTIGVLFVTVSITMTDEIRTDGKPLYAMCSMLAGAITNVILDWIFIFPLGMGVAGAALASIIGQFIGLLVTLSYLPRFKTLHLRLSNLKPNPAIIKSILIIGLPAFVTQMAGLIVNIVMNQQAVKYGAMSIYGPEIPLTVFGIVMKVNSIMLAFIMGTSAGAGPIFSYNYGAANYDRVRQLVKICMIATTTMGVIGMLAVQIFPNQIISAFGQEDSLYNEFAVYALTRMTILIFILGIQMTANSYFQAVGKPKLSMLVSLSRQILFMTPLLFLLPLAMGVKGICYSFVLGDVGSVTLCSILLYRELKYLGRQIEKQQQSP